MWSIVAAALSAVAVLVSGLAVLFAVRANRSERRPSSEGDDLRERVRELSERLESVERSVGEAATQAEVAGTVLLEKGIADEEDLEAARRRFDPASGDEPVPVRGTRTLH